MQLRAGLRPAFRSAMVGGVLLVSGWCQPMHFAPNPTHPPNLRLLDDDFFHSSGVQLTLVYRKSFLGLDQGPPQCNCLCRRTLPHLHLSTQPALVLHNILPASCRPMCVCASCQAMIEGLGITLSKTFSPPPPSMPFQQPGMPGGPPEGMPMQGMPGLPQPLPGPDLAAAPAADGGSSSSGGGFWSWLSGSEEPKVGGSTARG